MGPVRVLLLLLRGALRDRASLVAENLALRQQLAALQHKSKRPRLRKRDRIFWAILSWVWRDWRSALLIVLLVGTARASSCSGGGSPGTERLVGRRSRPRFVT